MQTLCPAQIVWDTIEKARELKPDLIVLDLSMPVMNGPEAAPVLRRMLPTVPIILFTLHDNKTLQRDAFFLGISAMVSKAANMKTLVDQAEDLLSCRLSLTPNRETPDCPV